MDSKDFLEKYKFENKLLFKNLTFQDEKEYDVLKDLIQIGLKQYFDKIKSRVIRKKKIF